MNRKPELIKHCEELRTEETFSYPGDTETFGTCGMLAKKMGLERIAVNYEVMEPGDRSSWPHAYKVEEEFAYVIEGAPQVWVSGEIHDLKVGDCIAFKPGTGTAYTFLNNSDSLVKLLVVGEQKVQDEKIFYPMHPKRNLTLKEKGHFWEGHPQNELGGHDGWTDKKRPVE